MGELEKAAANYTETIFQATKRDQPSHAELVEKAFQIGALWMRQRFFVHGSDGCRHCETGRVTIYAESMKCWGCREKAPSKQDNPGSLARVETQPETQARVDSRPGKSQSVKVYLRGESPYVTCLGMDDTGAMIGKIDNHLVNTAAHGYQYGDVLVFRRVEYDFGSGRIYSWEPFGRHGGIQKVQPNQVCTCGAPAGTHYPTCEHYDR